MKRLCALFFLLALAGFAQGQVSTKEVISSTSDPVTCVVGKLYINTTSPGKVWARVAGGCVRVDGTSAGAGTVTSVSGTSPIVVANPTTTPAISFSATATQLGSPSYAVDSVGTDSYAITLSPVVASLTDGLLVRFKAGTANTGAATLAVNGLTAKPLVKSVGGLSTALADNDIRAGDIVIAAYSSVADNFQVKSLLGNAPSGGITNSAGNNVIPKSDGTNIVASSISDDGTTISTTEPIAVTKNSAGATLISVFNGTVGSGSFAALRVGNDGSDLNTQLADFNASYSDVAAWTGNTVLSNVRAGGHIVLNARDSNGTIRFLTGGTGGTAKMTVNSDTTITLNTTTYASCTALTTNASSVLGCTVSSKKVKENFSPFRGGLSVLRRIQPQYFSFKRNTFWYKDGKQELGLVAENLKDADPHLVSTSSAGLQPEMMALHAAEISAIKELDARLLKLEKENRKLRSQIRRLRRR